MSESKVRLQRENDALRAKEALFEVLLKATRKARMEMYLIDREVAKATLDAALKQMPPEPPPPKPVYEREPSRAFRTFTALAAALGGGAGLPPMPLDAHSGLPHRGRR